MKRDYPKVFLRMLTEAGDKGVPNYVLSDVALQYNFVIYQLRKAGHDIQKRRVYRDGRASQTWEYYLVKAEPPKPTYSDAKAVSWLND